MDKLEYIPGDLVIYTSLIKEPIAEICEVHETSYTIKFMHGNSVRVENREIKPIRYVHELQHLLFGLKLNSEMEI